MRALFLKYYISREFNTKINIAYYIENRELRIKLTEKLLTFTSRKDNSFSLESEKDREDVIPENSTVYLNHLCH